MEISCARESCPYNKDQGCTATLVMIDNHGFCLTRDVRTKSDLDHVVLDVKDTIVISNAIPIKLNTEKNGKYMEVR